MLQKHIRTIMPKRKVLYIITKGNWGGAQRYVFDLATHLSKEEFEPLIAMGEGVALEKKLTNSGIRTVRLSSLTETRRARPQMADLRAFSELFQLLRRECPDIIHLNSSRASFLGVCASRLLSASCFLLHILNARRYALCAPRIIFTAHGWPFKEPRSPLVRHTLWLISYATALLAHHTIVLSEGDYERGKQMPSLRKKMSLIYNGIEQARVLPRSQARALLGLPSDGFVFGTIAELNRNKGIPTLIEALTSLPAKAHLCLIGDGEDAQKLRTLAHFRGVANRILFAGTRDEANIYLPAFDVFVLPSLKEGLPYTILEAGLSGIPVVASDISGIQDIIDTPEVGMLIPPQQAPELARALRKLMMEKQLREQLGRALQSRVKHVFPLSRMLKTTSELYR